MSGGPQLGFGTELVAEASDDFSDAHTHSHIDYLHFPHLMRLENDPVYWMDYLPSTELYLRRNPETPEKFDIKVC